MFDTLAELFKANGDAEGFRTALEPANSERMFSLGYAYSQSDSHWPMTMFHYGRGLEKAVGGAAARNNLAVIEVLLDKALGVENYERAAAEGDPFASANLAHLLITDGYITMAETILNGVPSVGDAAENHASARSAVLKARRRNSSRRDEVSTAAKVASSAVRGSLAVAFRSMRAGTGRQKGAFASDDRRALIVVREGDALCRIRSGLYEYEGTLKDQITCFAGWLGTKGGGILNSSAHEFTLIDEGGGVLRLFQWPGSVTLGDTVQSFELRSIEGLPELSPPPSPPSEPGSRASELIAAALRASSTAGGGREGIGDR